MGKGDRASESYYIETAPQSEVEFSCSFVEFDGKGDYLLFDQHDDVWKRVLNLAQDCAVLLVIYCHGWKNNSQSGDVMRFNDFLRRLASTPSVRKRGFRVHGVYLAWRGAAMKPHLTGNDDRKLDQQLQKHFGQSIVDRRCAQWVPSWLAFVPEQLTYWGRKAAAENDVSGAPISRTIFSLGYLLRRNIRHEHRVVLIGHSMGALMLEQSLANASLSKVMADWPWFTKDAPSGQDATVLPFDLVLLLNSAAPSIYAKQMRDFLAADRTVRLDRELPRPEQPVIISVTSESDHATGTIHHIGNLLAPLSPNMQREYDDVVKDQLVPQGYFYSRTPGHNPLLINRWIVAEDEPTRSAGENLFEENLRFTPEAPWTFYTSPRKDGEKPQAWRLTDVAPQAPKYLGRTADLIRRRANYWIIRAPGTLIRNHGDIWTQQCMEMMVAFWRMAETDTSKRPQMPADS